MGSVWGPYGMLWGGMGSVWGPYGTLWGGMGSVWGPCGGLWGRYGGCGLTRLQRWTMGVGRARGGEGRGAARTGSSMVTVTPRRCCATERRPAEQRPLQVGLQHSAPCGRSSNTAPLTAPPAGSPPTQRPLQVHLQHSAPCGRTSNTHFPSQNNSSATYRRSSNTDPLPSNNSALYRRTSNTAPPAGGPPTQRP